MTFAYILASLRGSSLCLYSGCYGGAVVFCNFFLCSGVADGQQPLSIFWLLRRSSCLPKLLPIFWYRCAAAAFVYFLAAAEEWLSSVTFAYILASLRGSSLCLYSGCGGGVALFSDLCLHSGVAAGQQPLSIFWLLRRSSCLP